MQNPKTSPLLALVGATAEWHAGTPPTCSVSVRLLDRVHFTVHRGDCVVVHHDDPAGARVLLAALAGSDALVPGRRLFGERRCAPSVRIRRCSISADALAAILDGWRDLHRHVSGTDDTPFEDPGGAVHLLRASRATCLTERERRQWRTWARRVRDSGGAVVAVARPEPVSAAAPTSSARVQELMPHRVRERAAHTHTHTNTPNAQETQKAPTQELALSASTPRGVWLRHGRLLNVREWE